MNSINNFQSTSYIRKRLDWLKTFGGKLMEMNGNIVNKFKRKGTKRKLKKHQSLDLLTISTRSHKFGKMLSLTISFRTSLIVCRLKLLFVGLLRQQPDSCLVPMSFRSATMTLNTGDSIRENRVISLTNRTAQFLICILKLA